MQTNLRISLVTRDWAVNPYTLDYYTFGNGGTSAFLPYTGTIRNSSDPSLLVPAGTPVYVLTIFLSAQGGVD